ncbi:MAG: phosphomannomutase/phosphoglucomutase [Gemmatimonadetes bacterium]|nr:phosphomannomutase/phosphoglucomutase [Gemmatimonadota bacterium]MCY3942671.1 phosphomannomutase/phosphoglucomutase [Gemmatimonadota bacterium]
MIVHEHIFREYDIRGVVGEELNAEVAEAIGRAYASELRECSGHASPVVAVGEDNRPSSPEIGAGLVRGLRSAGCDVLHLGTVPTPVTYFGEHWLGTEGAVQVTGSHNPSEYNGIKMTVGAKAVYGDAIQALLGRIRARGTVPAKVGVGSLRRVDPLPSYVADVSGRFSLEWPVRAVVDCGNGTGAVVAVELLRAVGVETIPLFCDSDGTFPNHHPDPTVDEYVQDLVAAVRAHGAHVGIGFDGDADRIGVVDELGRIVRGDMLLLLFALEILQREGPRGQSVVFDVKCSQVLVEEIRSAGGNPVMWKTGHSLIKEKMAETGAPIAGELSGHICFADGYYGFDDALYAACRLCNMLAASDRPLSAMVDDLPRRASSPEIRIEVAEEEKAGLVELASRHFAARYETETIDGVRVLFPTGWGLIRASNTQPVIVARYEARTAEDLAGIRAEIEGWLGRRGVAVDGLG